MTKTVRVYWSKLQGRVALSYPWPGAVNGRSVIHIAASEAGSWTPQPDGTATVSRIAGAADVYVMAIAPKQDRVDFILKVDWKSPLDVVTDITLFDPPSAYVQQQSTG